MKISAVVLAKKQSPSLDRCLQSVNFCDEKLVLKGDIMDFAKQRNLGLGMARYDWVFFVDSDEEVSEGLKSEILKLNFDKDAYYIKRRDFFWGKEMKYGETMKVRNKGLIRLVKKSSGRWYGTVHEEFRIQSLKYKVGRLNSYLNHYPHQTLKEFIEDVNYYSSLRAEQLYQTGKKFYLHELLLLPFLKFILNYFVYFGMLDGVAGFVYAFLMSFHSFLVRAKLYNRA